jgi:hypothetical protein
LIDLSNLLKLLLFIDTKKDENNDSREMINIKKEKVKTLSTQDIVKNIKDFLKKEKISRLFFSTYVLKISRQYFIEIIDHPIKWENLSAKGREPYINMNKFMNDDIQINNFLTKHKNEQMIQKTSRDFQVQKKELLNSPPVQTQLNEMPTDNVLDSRQNSSNDKLVDTNNRSSIQHESNSRIEISSINKNISDKTSDNLVQIHKNDTQNFELQNETKKFPNGVDEDDQVIVINDSDSEDDRSVIEVGSYYRNECYLEITEDNEECINIKFEIGDS